MSYFRLHFCHLFRYHFDFAWMSVYMYMYRYVSNICIHVLIISTYTVINGFIYAKRTEEIDHEDVYVSNTCIHIPACTPSTWPPPPHIHTHILNYTYAYRHVCRLITPYISMSIHINVYVFIIGICIYLYRYIYTVYIHCVHLYRYVLILSFICFLFIFISFFVHSQSFRFSLLLYCRMHERHFACFFSWNYLNYKVFLSFLCYHLHTLLNITVWG